MKKILIRSGISAYDVRTESDLLKGDFVGGNSGNLIFVHGIMRNLTTDQVILESDYYLSNSAKAEYINKNYDGYIIPLADAFRADFEDTLKDMTTLIKRLTVPVYLIGVGLKAPKDVMSAELKFPFDDTVRNFIKAILEKSSMVGVRGEITAQYLTNLGFKKGIDHIAIGCPSMYTYGENLKIREIPNVEENELLISTNRSKSAPKHVLKYIHNIHSQNKKAAFLPQGWDEFKLMYTGFSTIDIPNYPSKITDLEYANGEARYFLSASEWISYLKNRDFSFGTKLHGNITATIAGTPSISIPIDARMRELAEFHGLCTLNPEEIHENETLTDLINKVDIYSAEKKTERKLSKFHKISRN
ncbi:polysaccharide pyruvyl transferase family protein [Brochothrix campestris]|uniref:Polysaccharide pyruvyl transferase domain-containing protein n=1 Tax=Brochothrix campestris FSL F6-1037 TaxID=1265861 RepID=W7CJ54_9LIST|nr:polysaccharide pyruvyl transferase family protein [Brochothrix campestris]EUJ39404.1 hypothetical protein BCAMP_07205 [Brochothrix campestris FSL F6-1037]